MTEEGLYVAHVVGVFEDSHGGGAAHVVGRDAALDANFGAQFAKVFAEGAAFVEVLSERRFCGERSRCHNWRTKGVGSLMSHCSMRARMSSVTGSETRAWCLVVKRRKRASGS